jgi:hypothetical protein
MILAAGCSLTPVQLQHSQTGQTVQCTGTYWSWGYFIAASAQDDCVKQYEQAGYRRTGPTGPPRPLGAQRWRVVAVSADGKPELLGVPQDTLEGCRSLLDPLAKLYPSRKLSCEVEQ